MKKILLVCAADCREMEECLVRGGCLIARAKNGVEALSRAKHEKVDAAVLISTGKEMDFAETALNLRDIDSSVEIILVADFQHPKEQRGQADVIAKAIPQARILRTCDLARYLGLSSEPAKPPLDC